MSYTTQYYNKQDWIRGNQKLLVDLFNEDIQDNNTPFPIEGVKAAIVAGAAMIPEVGDAISLVIDTVWSTIDQLQSSNDMQNYINAVMDVIDDKINVYDNASLSSLFQGLRLKMNNFIIDLKILKANPKNEAYKECARFSFMLLESSIEDAIEVANKEGHEIEELPMYAIFATSHLAVLRDGIMLGASLGFGPNTITKKYQWKFQKYLAQYTSHCISTYKAGIAKLNSLCPDNIIRMNKVLAYRSNMIIQVFDYVHMWSCFNPISYPDGVVIDRFRYVYSNICGFPIDSQSSTNRLYYSATCSQIQSVIDSNEAYKGELATCRVGFNRNFFLNIQNTHVNPKDQSGKLTDPLIGVTNGITGYYDFQFNSSPQSATITFDIVPRGISFNLSGTQVTTVDADGIDTRDWAYAKDYPTSYDFPGYEANGGLLMISDPHAIGTINPLKLNSFSYPGHKVANVISIGTNYDEKLKSDGALDSFLVAFEPVENFRNSNVIFKNLVTMIDVQKFTSKDSNVTFQKDFNDLIGSHAYFLPMNQGMTFTFTLEDSAVKKFLVGVCVTSNQKSSSKIKIFVEAVEKTAYPITIASKSKVYWSDLVFDMSVTPKLTFKIGAQSNGCTLQQILFKPAPPPQA